MRQNPFPRLMVMIAQPHPLSEVCAGILDLRYWQAQERVREWTIEWKEAGRTESERQALERDQRLLLYQVQQRFGEASALPR